MYLTTRKSYNDFFNEMFRAPFFNDTADSKVMKTDVREVEQGFVIDMELPGYQKEDIQAELNDGYLTVTAKRAQTNEQKDANGKYIRKERFEGTCKRSFYIGEYLHQEDIKASYKDGILRLEIPKETEPQPEQPKLITID